MRRIWGLRGRRVVLRWVGSMRPRASRRTCSVSADFPLVFCKLAFSLAVSAGPRPLLVLSRYLATCRLSCRLAMAFSMTICMVRLRKPTGLKFAPGYFIAQRNPEAEAVGGGTPARQVASESQTFMEVISPNRHHFGVRNDITSSETTSLRDINKHEITSGSETRSLRGLVPKKKKERPIRDLFA